MPRIDYELLKRMYDYLEACSEHPFVPSLRLREEVYEALGRAEVDDAKD